MSDTDRPDPAWLSALLEAHRTGSRLQSGSGGGHRKMTRTQLGGLLAGASDEACAVFRLRYLGHVDEWETVYKALAREARRVKGWREFEHVGCESCLERLVGLVVDEERLPPPQVTTAFRARQMGTTRGAWRHRYDKAHKILKKCTEEWANEAISQAKFHIREID
jgi:hypothetical protein